jgi:hypothetical protein
MPILTTLQAQYYNIIPLVVTRDRTTILVEDLHQIGKVPLCERKLVCIYLG